MPWLASMVDESDPLVDSPLSSPTTSPYSSAADLQALVAEAEAEPEPEPELDAGDIRVLLANADVRSTVLLQLNCFELVRLRRVSRELNKWAQGALEGSVSQLGDPTVAQWLGESNGPAAAAGRAQRAAAEARPHSHACRAIEAPSPPFFHLSPFLRLPEEIWPAAELVELSEGRTPTLDLVCTDVETHGGTQELSTAEWRRFSSDESECGLGEGWAAFVKEHKLLAADWVTITQVPCHQHGRAALKVAIHRSRRLPPTHHTLSKLLALCPGVSNIDLAAFGRDAVTDEMLETVAQRCRSLCTLEAAGTGELTDIGVRALCRNGGCCKTLERVVLTENFALGDAALEALALAAPDLTQLEAEATGVSDMGLLALANSCSKGLRLLNAGYCRGVTDRSVRQLVTCTALEALTLTACAGVTGAGIAAVCQGCASLTSLRVDQCTDVTDVSLKALASSGQLKTLTIGQCTAITDSTLELLGRCSPNLTRLDIWGVGLITDDGLSAVATGCAELQHLDASRCAGLSDGGLAKVPAHCHRLRELRLSSCRAGTETLLAAGTHCPALRHLSTNYSQQGRVSDDGLLAVANGCPDLRHLEVCSSPGITDVSLVALAANCRSIEHVDFSACPRVSDAGVKALAGTGTLTDVYLGGCAVTDDSVAALRENCPELHYLFISCTQTSAAVADSAAGSPPTAAGSALHIHR